MISFSRLLAKRCSSLQPYFGLISLLRTTGALAIRSVLSSQTTGTSSEQIILTRRISGDNCLSKEHRRQTWVSRNPSRRSQPDRHRHRHCRPLPPPSPSAFAFSLSARPTQARRQSSRRSAARQTSQLSAIGMGRWYALAITIAALLTNFQEQQIDLPESLSPTVYVSAYC